MTFERTSARGSEPLVVAHALGEVDERGAHGAACHLLAQRGASTARKRRILHARHACGYAAAAMARAIRIAHQPTDGSNREFTLHGGLAAQDGAGLAVLQHLVGQTYLARIVNIHHGVLEECDRLPGPDELGGRRYYPGDTLPSAYDVTVDVAALLTNLPNR